MFCLRTDSLSSNQLSAVFRTTFSKVDHTLGTAMDSRSIPKTVCMLFGDISAPSGNENMLVLTHHSTVIGSSVAEILQYNI